MRMVGVLVWGGGVGAGGAGGGGFDMVGLGIERLVYRTFNRFGTRTRLGPLFLSLRLR